jgi:hypothetical protein
MIGERTRSGAPPGISQQIKPHVENVLVCDLGQNGLHRAGKKNERIDEHSLILGPDRVCDRRIREKTPLGLPMDYSMARCAEDDQVLSNVVTQSTSWLNVMNLEGLASPTALATPAIAVKDFAAKLAISFRVKP